MPQWYLLTALSSHLADPEIVIIKRSLNQVPCLEALAAMVASWYVYCAKFKIQRTAGEIVKAWIDARNGYTVRSLTHNIVFVRDPYRMRTLSPPTSNSVRQALLLTSLVPSGSEHIQHTSEVSSDMSSTDRWLARLPRRWHLGVIVGGTGTGKTRALHELRDAGFISNILSASASAADWPAELAVVSVIANSELVAKAARKVTPPSAPRPSATL